MGIDTVVVETNARNYNNKRWGGLAPIVLGEDLRWAYTGMGGHIVGLQLGPLIGLLVPTIYQLR